MSVKILEYVQNTYKKHKKMVKEMKFKVINVIIVVKNFNQKEDQRD